MSITSTAASAARRDPADLHVRIVPHEAPPPPRQSCASSSRCTRARGRSAVFDGEIGATGTGRRCYVVAKVGSTVVGYAGVLYHSTATATSPTSPSTRPSTAHKIGTRLLLTLARQARMAGLQEPDARGAGRATRARRRCTSPSASRRSGMRKRYYEDVDDAIVMWAHDIDSPEYAAALDATRGGHRPVARRGTGWREATRLPCSRSASARSSSASRRRATRRPPACVMGGHDVLSSVVSSQVDLHAQFGGVVPEIASRAHLELIMPVVARAIVEAGIDDARIDAVAATVGPGLIGALLVGVSAAKALALDVGRALRRRQPPRGAPLRRASSRSPTSSCRSSCCSSRVATRCWSRWGRTAEYRLLGQTIDDAAGEAFDKVARYLGLGYPGGPAIDRDRHAGRPRRPSRFPRADAPRRPRLLVQRPEDGGREPRAQASRREHGRRGRQLPAGRGGRARRQGAPGGAAEVGAKGLALGGGVAANSLAARAAARGLRRRTGSAAFLPSRAMCTDNAAMIAATGWHRLRSDGPSPLDTPALPNLRLQFAL